MEIQLIFQSIIYGSNLVQQLSNCKKNLFQAECHHLVTVNLGLIREYKKHVRRKKRLYNKARRTGLEVDWFRFKDAAARSRKTCKKAYNNFISSSVASNNKSDSKRFFSFIKSKRNENVGISPLRENSTMKIADKDKARILNHQFSSVFSIDDQKTPEIKSPRAYDMNDIIITTGGVKKLLDDLNVYKANGPDGIPARMLKETSN